MIPYEIQQKESSVKSAYMNLLNNLNECITLRAKAGLSFSSLVGFKRQLYRFKKVIVADDVKDNSSRSSEHDIMPNNAVSLLVEDVFNKMGVDVLDAVKKGLIGSKELKKALIKHDYEQLAKEGLKYKDIKTQLSEKYGFSVSSIEKLVYGRRSA